MVEIEFLCLMLIAGIRAGEFEREISSSFSKFDRDYKIHPCILPYGPLQLAATFKFVPYEFVEPSDRVQYTLH